MIEDLQLSMKNNVPLRDAVFETLREAILKGQLAPGQHLMEMQLAYQLGVSRTPVREAIRLLELEGLVNMIPRKGARVAAISEKSLCDVLEVRRALEELSIRLACSRITREGLERLNELNQEFLIACQSDDIVNIATIDEKFHDVINQASDNDKLIQLLKQLQNQMYRYRVEHIKMKSGRRELVEEHKAIISALMKQDEAAACAAIKNHIYRQEMQVMDMINNR